MSDGQLARSKYLSEAEERYQELLEIKNQRGWTSSQAEEFRLLEKDLDKDEMRFL